jgi:aminoglycoside N3'-acetyltransferase
MRATRSSLNADLIRLGIKSKAVLMVHTSVRAIGEVTGGVNAIVQALLNAIGPEATLAAYVDFEPFADSHFPANRGSTM